MKRVALRFSLSNTGIARTVALDVEAVFEIRSNEPFVNLTKLVIRKILSAYVVFEVFRCILGDIGNARPTIILCSW